MSCGAFCGRFVRSDTRRALHHPQIVAAPSSSSIESEVNILSVGSPKWRNVGRFPFHIMWQQSQVLVNGKLHWITYTTRNNAAKPIMSFDLGTEQFKEVPRPDSVGPDRHIHELVVLRGCLSAVSFNINNKEVEIWVMGEYDVKESWVKEFSIGAYVPKPLQPNDQRETLNSSMFYLPKKHMRVLCMLSDGRILLESNNKSLVLYDPHCRTFNDLQVTFEGIPRYFRALVHVSSLNWIDT
ncbi:F-Box Protein92 [Hibiscus trionum]|uniref:F-Box Protein92 n=1 Tax=Hibiscus trionum TaxID=183268 RepID=A0A9W7GVB0_HIBTR|nr:F-Box Protein92 [Hibiscus trionum]